MAYCVAAISSTMDIANVILPTCERRCSGWAAAATAAAAAAAFARWDMLLHAALLVVRDAHQHANQARRGQQVCASFCHADTTSCLFFTGLLLRWVQSVKALVMIHSRHAQA